MVTLAAPAELALLERSEARVDVELSNGQRATAPLLALCEGRQSTTRDRIGISVRQWRYGQTASSAVWRTRSPTEASPWSASSPMAHLHGCR